MNLTGLWPAGYAWSLGVYYQAMSRIFFYGLFMDPGLLREKGLPPTLVGPAELPGYQIHTGNRAS